MGLVTDDVTCSFGSSFFNSAYTQFSDVHLPNGTSSTAADISVVSANDLAKNETKALEAPILAAA